MVIDSRGKKEVRQEVYKIIKSNNGRTFRQLLKAKGSFYTEKTERDKAKGKIDGYFNNLRTQGVGDLEVIYIACALLKIDAIETFPILKGQPRKINGSNKNILNEPATDKQFATLKAIEEKLGIKIYCSSKWGAWIVINNFMPQHNEERKEENDEIKEWKEYCSEREKLIGQATCRIRSLNESIEQWKREWIKGRHKICFLEALEEYTEWQEANNK